MKKILTLLFLISPLVLKADKVKILTEVDEKPVLAGSDHMLDSFVEENQQCNHLMNFTIEFTITKKGKMEDVVFTKSVRTVDCDSSVKQVINLMADTYTWKPAKLNGKAVSVKASYSFNNFDLAQVNAVPPPPPAPKHHKYDSSVVFDFVEQMPEFPGGMQALDQFVLANFMMPDSAVKAKAEGKIYVSFIVDEQGKVTDIEILKDGVGYGCAEELVRVLNLMASKFTWTPGRQLGKPIKVRYRYPVVIRR